MIGAGHQIAAARTLLRWSQTGSPKPQASPEHHRVLGGSGVEIPFGGFDPPVAAIDIRWIEGAWWRRRGPNRGEAFPSRWCLASPRWHDPGRRPVVLGSKPPPPARSLILGHLRAVWRLLLSRPLRDLLTDRRLHR